MNKKRILGYSIIEILVVIGIFTVLSVIATQTVILSLRGAKKSESIINVKEELDYASDIISRQLQNSRSITNPSPCNGNTTTITYTNQYYASGIFTCEMGGSIDKYIASRSGASNYRLTSQKVYLTACSFSCNTFNGNIRIVFNITGKAKDTVDVEGYNYSTSRYIFIQASKRQ